jgi:hypothetical protein
VVSWVLVDPFPGSPSAHLLWPSFVPGWSPSRNEVSRHGLSESQA